MYLSFFSHRSGIWVGEKWWVFCTLPDVSPTDFRWCALLQKCLVLHICHSCMYKTQFQPFCVSQYKMLSQGCYGKPLLTSAFLLCSLDEQNSLERICSFSLRALLPPRGIGQNHQQMLHDLHQLLTDVPSEMGVGYTEGSRWISSEAWPQCNSQKFVTGDFWSKCHVPFVQSQWQSFFFLLSHLFSSGQR